MDWGAIIGCILFIGVPSLISIVMMDGESSRVDGLIDAALNDNEIEWEEEVM